MCLLSKSIEYEKSRKKCVSISNNKPPKTNMTMAKQLFEDASVSPIRNGDFPLPC